MPSGFGRLPDKNELHNEVISHEEVIVIRIQEDGKDFMGNIGALMSAELVYLDTVCKYCINLIM